MQNRNNIHVGHRKRRFDGMIRNGGIEAFSDVEIVETILYYSIMRANTNNTAHKYLDLVGNNACDMLSSSPRELISKLGCAVRSAVVLSIVGRYKEIVNNNRPYKRNTQFCKEDAEKNLYKFEKSGSLSDFTIQDILDMFLFISVKDNSVGRISDELKKEFPNTREIFMISPGDMLQRVDVLNQKTLCFLSMPRFIERRYSIFPKIQMIVLDNHYKMAAHLHAYFDGRNEELLYVLCLNDKYEEITTVCLSKGGISSVMVDTDKIALNVLSYRADIVTLAHNHPSGMLEYSVEDINFTNSMIAAFKALNIKLYDHLIFSGSMYRSFLKNSVFQL